MNEKPNQGNLLFAFILVVGLIAITRFTSLKPHWGTLEMRPSATITVSGTAKKEQANQIATFTAGVESIEASKEDALNKANEAMNELIAKVKAFGIEDQDIKTENASVYQETEYEAEIMIYPAPDRGNAKKGDWRANNSVTIKLKDVAKAEELLAILNSSGANYVYGPNFSVDDLAQSNDELLTEAVANAREKAERIAKSNQQSVGKMISVIESGNYPFYAAYESAMPMAMGSAKSITDANLEPGSSLSSKTVTVTFELN